MIGPTDLLHPSPAPHFKIFQVFLIYCPKRSRETIIQNVIGGINGFLKTIEMLQISRIHGEVINCVIDGTTVIQLRKFVHVLYTCVLGKTVTPAGTGTSCC
jgi:hypothetical protein